MKSWKSFSTFAAASALVATNAWAVGMPAGAPAPYGELMTQADNSRAAEQGYARDDIAMPQTAEGPILEGQVAAVDHESGQLVLDTDAGTLALVADPRDVANVSIGDVIEVALLDDERD